jgi:hypothetical protein
VSIKANYLQDGLLENMVTLCFAAILSVASKGWHTDTYYSQHIQRPRVHYLLFWTPNKALNVETTHSHKEPLTLLEFPDGTETNAVFNTSASGGKLPKYLSLPLEQDSILPLKEHNISVQHQ